MILSIILDPIMEEKKIPLELLVLEGLNSEAHSSTAAGNTLSSAIISSFRRDVFLTHGHGVFWYA